MAGDSPAAVIVDGVNGNEVAVEEGVAIPALTRALLVAGQDAGGLAQFLQLSASGALEIAKPTAATVTPVAQSATVVTLLATNASRKGGAIYNDANRILYVKLGAGASASDHSFPLAPGGVWEIPFPSYTGQITGVWTAAGGGSARVTETT